jgi:hypothetical protein
MKVVPLGLWDPQKVGSNLEVVDVKSEPQLVLECIDKQLRPFGIEVVLYEGDTDEVGWMLEQTLPF